MACDLRLNLVDCAKQLHILDRGQYTSLSAGRMFNLNEDWDSFQKACAAPENLAKANGMLRALADGPGGGVEKALYVIYPETEGVCKIGVSSDPMGRLAQLQGANWERLKIASVIFFPTKKSMTVEQGILAGHDEAGTRLQGEWVKSEPEDLIDEIFAFAKDSKIPICDGATWFDNLVRKTRQLHGSRVLRKAS